MANMLLTQLEKDFLKFCINQYWTTLFKGTPSKVKFDYDFTLFEVMILIKKLNEV